MATPTESVCGPGNWRVLAKTQEEEDAYDQVKYRKVKFVGTIGSIAHLIKGALGAGILGGHAAYADAGIGVALPATVFFGSYMCLCFYLLVSSTQVLCKRTRTPLMSYSDAGEASVACFPNPKVQRMSKCFRYCIDIFVSIDLFGSCACYQIIIAKSIKQLVEDVPGTTMHGINGYPHLRVYLGALIPLLMIMCLMRHLKYLAPFSIVANLVVVICLGTTVYFAVTLNPNFEGLVLAKGIYGFFQFVGLNIFSMSCIGIIIPVEGNMRHPKRFPLALVIAMFFIMSSTIILSFFGYAAFLEESESPITVNFPMETFPKILKVMIAIMIVVTYALNFWVPFNLCFYYIARRLNQAKIVLWELLFRVIFVLIIGIVAIVFPDINALMGFIGCLCLSNMAFIWPNIIYILTVWERPGLGTIKWRLIMSIILIIIGLFILCVGSVINAIEMYKALVKSFS